MNLDRVFQGLNISASGLIAERVRMGVIATNIAHSSDTNRGDGEPYHRKEVVFQTALRGALAGGVQVAGVVEDDRTPFQRVERKGHPDADENGMLKLPNVMASFEMVDLMTASRAYEANLEVAQVTLRMAEQALELGR